MRGMNDVEPTLVATCVRPISWTQFPGRGRGIVTRCVIRPNAILEVAPAIPMDVAGCDKAVGQYLFVINRDECNSLPKTFPSSSHALVFGIMSFCNHAPDPNARVYFHLNTDGGLEACLIATQHILEQEEVTIRYPDLAWYQDRGML